MITFQISFSPSCSASQCTFFELMITFFTFVLYFIFIYYQKILFSIIFRKVFFFNFRLQNRLEDFKSRNIIEFHTNLLQIGHMADIKRVRRNDEKFNRLKNRKVVDIFSICFHIRIQQEKIYRYGI